MDDAGYTTLTRQSGLLQQMQVIANNIANAPTTGFRAQSLIFSEHINAGDTWQPSLSMATARVQQSLNGQGALSQTGGTFDLAIEGDGFFLVATPEGTRLTRSGAFTTNENGDLVTVNGHAVMDTGEAPVFIPQGLGPVGISADGTISAGGAPVGQIGLFRPLDPDRVEREGNVLLNPIGGVAAQPDGRMKQGFLEGANVDPLLEMSRMINVQRAYELGQSFLDKEDQRIRTVIDAISR
ncbi:flagellar hook-basal body complex protein [Yoonia litorea]|uniref:Flagellar basal-body rod protein FlgF n=1 Tax=Yoonia litorea TaxID=1123755 RepID=A0A1I6MUA3_9RHOB|nr:flagellar hook-basal body complex protein [Yoonia litorea]SFS19217.1 flagellar basal-body rod protein FlgF [Yoonia litorea]